MRTSRGSGLAGGAVVVGSGGSTMGAEAAASPARRRRPLGSGTAMALLLGPPSGRRHPAAGGGVSGVFEEVRPGRVATALRSSGNNAEAEAPAWHGTRYRPRAGDAKQCGGRASKSRVRAGKRASPPTHTRAPLRGPYGQPTLGATEARRRQR